MVMNSMTKGQWLMEFAGNFSQELYWWGKINFSVTHLQVSNNFVCKWKILLIFTHMALFLSPRLLCGPHFPSFDVFIGKMDKGVEASLSQCLRGRATWYRKWVVFVYLISIQHVITLCHSGEGQFQLFLALTVFIREKELALWRHTNSQQGSNARTDPC